MRLAAAAGHLLTAALGATVGLACVVAHRGDLNHLAVGLLLGLSGTFAIVWALWLSAVRRLAASFCTGWLLVFGQALLGRPEGDVAVAADASGYAMIAAAMLLVAVGMSALFSRDDGSRGAAYHGDS